MPLWLNEVSSMLGNLLSMGPESFSHRYAEVKWCLSKSRETHSTTHTSSLSKSPAYLGESAWIKPKLDLLFFRPREYIWHMRKIYINRVSLCLWLISIWLMTQILYNSRKGYKTNKLLRLSPLYSVLYTCTGKKKRFLCQLSMSCLILNDSSSHRWKESNSQKG